MKTRKQHNQYHLVYKKERRNEVITFLGGKCVRCGFDDKRALQIDHVNGGGVEELRTVKDRQRYYRDIIKKHGEGYQLLCANCNWIKRAENKEVGKMDITNKEQLQLSNRQIQIRYE